MSYFCGVRSAVERSIKAFPVQTKLACILLKRRNVECVLSFKQNSRVLKKLSLSIRRIRRLGSLTRIGMLRKRKVAHYKSNFVAIRLQHLFQYGMHGRTCRTLKVREFDHGGRSIRW